MLIGFAAKNFRSFKNDFAISFQSSNYYKENEDTLLVADIPGLKGTRILPVTAIYGANASGKSTVMAAIKEMRSAVLSLNNVRGDHGAIYSPFMLDDKSSTEPTTFSIEFCTLRAVESGESQQVRYEYSFSFTHERIISEDLQAYFTKMPRKLFSRHLSEAGETIIEDSTTFPILKEVRNLIGERILILSFFSQADQSKTGKEARIITDWFRDKLEFVNRSPGAEPLQMLSGEILDGVQGTDYQRAVIRQIMSKADTGLSSVEIEHLPVNNEAFLEVAQKVLSSDIIESLKVDSLKHVAFKHRTSKGAYEVPAESDGTMQLFILSGYIAKALDCGDILFVDELDASLHPDLATALISLFLDNAINDSKAQLIFTAHNPCLMNNELMRRDEFWITRKNEDGISELYPISDYKARKGESIESAYMQGRYSGAPLIPECLGMCNLGCNKEALEHGEGK